MGLEKSYRGVPVLLVWLDPSVEKAVRRMISAIAATFHTVQASLGKEDAALITAV